MNFEKLQVWQRSVTLSAALYKGLSELRDFSFRDQITRSGLSIPSNIAEGMTRRTDKEKIHFLVVARSSCAELRTQVYLGIDIGYIHAKLGKQWLEETREISAMINGLMVKLQNND
ncbi:four helix bundle protein [Oceanisphaera avium]|uniref:Four helix bundle protein n=1 Tax=Oceanisphaera avium TaxID=1903694 RepID=A0A1Y0CX56_9GAMM|nr:four helix bundle protein [Oceanisphaera avium]ART79425.1 four helix bundle protein [Oceanisphaera avium]